PPSEGLLDERPEGFVLGEALGTFCDGGGRDGRYRGCRQILALCFGGPGSGREVLQADGRRRRDDRRQVEGRRGVVVVCLMQAPSVLDRLTTELVDPERFVRDVVEPR